MLKRASLVLSVLLIASAALWLSRRSGDTVPVQPGAEVSKTPEVARPPGQDSPEAEDAGEKIPRSQRHAAGEIERHQASRAQLVALEKAVREQEEKLRERRKVLAAIVRTQGIIYQGTDMRIEPPAQAPAIHPDRAETPGDPGHQAEMDKKDAEERGRAAVAYVGAKQDFETDQELLNQMKLKLDEERARLKAAGD